MSLPVRVIIGVVLCAIESQDARRCYPSSTQMTSSAARHSGSGGKSTVIVRSTYVTVNVCVSVCPTNPCRV